MTLQIIETEIIEKILFLSQKIQKFWDAYVFKNSGLTILQFNILGVITATNGCTINQLKKSLVVSSASLSQTLNRMEKSWFVKRQLGKLDKREINLMVTPSWKKVYNELNKIYIQAAIKRFAKVTEKDKKEMMYCLNFIDKTLWTS